MRVLALFSVLGLATAVHAANPVPTVPAGVYTLDKAHTSLVFRVNHMGFSHFTGRFTRLDATLATDPSKLTTSRLDVTIDPTSISSDNAPDGFLSSLSGKGWLEAQDFPEIRYHSTKIEQVNANTLRVYGELTLHGVTKPVTLDAKYNGGYAGFSMDPQARIGFSARGTLKRSDFGISFGIPAAGTTMGVSDEVEIVLETELKGPPLAKN